jgi:hypothetical protein
MTVACIAIALLAAAVVALAASLLHQTLASRNTPTGGDSAWSTLRVGATAFAVAAGLGLTVVGMLISSP